MLLGRLHDAQDDHDAAMRAGRPGVAAATLEADIERWLAVGAAIADLARLVRRHCLASTFGDARPEVEPLTARLAEAIDDQVDAVAWGVIAAQARLLAVGVGE